jgi:hypothetical protein
MTPKEPTKPESSQPINLDRIKAAHAAKMAARHPLGTTKPKS